MIEQESTQREAAQESEVQAAGIQKLARLLETYRGPEKLTEAKRAGLLDSSPELLVAKAHPAVFDSAIRPLLPPEIQEELTKPFPENARGFGAQYQEEFGRRIQLITPTLLTLDANQIRQIGLDSFTKYIREGKPEAAVDVAAVFFLTEKRAEAEAAVRHQ